MSKIMITLNEIREHNPCEYGWVKLLKAKGKTKANDENFPLSDILETNDLDDCLWALRCKPEHNNLWRKYAVWCARQVEHLMEDERSKSALNVAWRHSDNAATDKERAAARAAAWAAAWDADRDAARDAAWAAAWAAARAAAWDAAMDAARAAARAAAWDAAMDAAWAAAMAAAMDAQTKKLKEILDAGEWVE